MKISEYLKRCRDRLGLIQEALSHELYLFDLERFAGVDTTTFSKWERGVTAPPFPRLKRLPR
jgi:transcriptional regulator with XRE-family HTH domain